MAHGPGGPGSPVGEVRVTPSSGPGAPPMLLIFAITVTGISGNSLLASSVPTILDELGEPSSRAGALVAAGSVAGIVVAPVIGVLADRFGRRNVLTPCLVIFGLAGGLTALAPSYEALLSLRLLQGVGSAGLINLAVVVIGDYHEGRERARLIGLNAAVLTVALAVLPPVGGLVTEHIGWRYALAPYSLGLLTAVLVAVRLPNVRYGAHEQTLTGQLRASIGYLKIPVVAATIATGFAVFVMIFGLMLTGLPLRLEETFNLEASAIGAMLGVSALSAAAVAANIRRFRERVTARQLVVLGLVAQVLGLAVMGTGPSLVIVAIGVTLFGLGEGALMPTLQDVVSEAAPDEGRGAVMAIWVGGARAGQSSGGLLLTAGLATGLTLSGAFLVGALALAIVATLQLSKGVDLAPAAS